MKTASLGKIADIIMGQAPKGDTYNNQEKGLPLIAGASDFGNIYPNPSRYTSSPTKISQKGDIIICVRATIGDLNWSNSEFCLGRGVAALRAKKDLLYPKYLWWVLKAGEADLVAKGRGATFKQISRADIAEYEVPFPNISEQKKVAEILDQADELRRARRKSIEQLYMLSQGIFYEMFGKNFLKENDRLEDIINVRSKLLDPKKEENKNLPHIGPEHIVSGSGEINYKKVKTALEDGITSGKYYFDENCIRPVAKV